MACVHEFSSSDATGLVPHWSQYFPWMGLTGRIESAPIWAKMKNLGSKKEKGVIQILDAKAFRKEGMEWEEHGAKGGG